ncbi:uncharacterized protein LOC143766927 [Ranitomeya variabilis]|uniref:uncharacterized protein LOC143766927 n=1 Tax=Ranitomeya variabilis TaxID=490064 RepID=UPI004055B8C3
MESVRTAIPLIGQDWVMATVDLRDVYYHVPIHPEFRKYIRFAISQDQQIVHYQFNSLPFGIASAPRVFTKIMTEAIIFIRLQGICIVPYLDDLLIVAPSISRLKSDLTKSLEILKSLGWIPNLEKSDLLPSKKKKFLGVLLDSELRRSFLPRERQLDLVQRVTAFRTLKAPTLRHSMYILGSLTSCIQMVPWAQAHTRVLQTHVLASWDRQQSSLSKRICLPNHVRTSLTWWLHRRNLQRGVSWDQVPLKTLTSDASQRGWGAIVDGTHFQDRWPPDIRASSSNFRELKAVEEALKAASVLVQGHHVRIYSDNVTTVAYLRHQGGTKYKKLKTLASNNFFWAERHLLSISAVHLKGSANTQADFLSRKDVHPGEWCLNQEVFLSLISKWGIPEVDLFANSQNAKVQTYISP